MASLLEKRRSPLNTRSSFYEMCITSVMLYGAEVWPMTQELQDTLRKCVRWMLRFTVGVRWQDWGSSKEVARRCNQRERLKKNETEKVTMVWACKKRDSGRDGDPRKDVCWKTKKTWKATFQQYMIKLNIKERDAQDRATSRKIIARLTQIMERDRF